jgi:RHS repeat-associated protein
MVVNESKPNSGNGTELRPVPTLDVWFDDIEVVHTEALIVQENHYDPYGLSLSGIEKENKPEDKWKFQDKELITELDLNWQDFGARFYDPQLGRWHCVDPADQFSSSYVGLANNPVTAVDPDGRLAWFVPIIIGAVVGGTFGVVRAANNPDMTLMGGFWRGAVVGGVGGALSLIGPAAGGAATFGQVIGWGAAQGAVTGGLDAALWGNNIGKGMLWGGVSGAVFATISSPQLKNAWKGQGFRNNDKVLADFVWNGKYQEALEYFGFGGKFMDIPFEYDIEKLGQNARDPGTLTPLFSGETDVASKSIIYSTEAFSDGGKVSYDKLKYVFMKEKFQLDRVLRGKVVRDTDLPSSMQLYPEEINGAMYAYKNQGLYSGYARNQNFLRMITSFQEQASYRAYSENWWDFLYRLPRRFGVVR